MAISQIPVIPNQTGFSIIIPSANTFYALELTLRGTYIVNSVSSAVIRIVTSSNQVIDNTGGFFQFSNPSPSRITISSTQNNTLVVFTNIDANSNRLRQYVLDVVSTTSTYAGTGTAKIIAAIGGGSAGTPGGVGSVRNVPVPQVPLQGPSSKTSGGGGAGGAGGKVTIAYDVVLPGSTPVVVGAGGSVPGGAGGDSSILSVSSGSGAFAPGGSGAAPQFGFPQNQWVGTAGSAGQINPQTNIANLFYLGFATSGGAPSPAPATLNDSVSGFGGAGGRAAGGSGGPAGPGSVTHGGGGGGGGGFSSGSNGTSGAQYITGPAGVGVGGAGGAGAVCILRPI